MFKGDNLANLRIMHGLSRNQLAKKSAVTEQAIWQYENDYVSPNLQTINTLKSLFQVKTKYFYIDCVLIGQKTSTNINVMNIAYRSKVLHTISNTRTEAKHLEFLDTFIDELTTSIRYPTLKIIKLRDQVIDYMSETNDAKSTQIENIAKLSREWIGLDHQTNDQLLLQIEKSGVFIVEKAMGKKIDAYSLWTENNRPYIILGNVKCSAARRNFDLAHELGHLLLHCHVEFAHLHRKDHRAIEKEADTFASVFLLPAENFSKDMETVTRLTNPDTYVHLKKKWKVSIQVLAYRALSLGIMEPKTQRNFYVALHRKGYRKQEPLDQELAIQKPMKVKALIDFAANNGLLDIQRLLEETWKVELPFLARLTGIDIIFFEKYINTDQTASPAQVTDLSSYR